MLTRRNGFLEKKMNEKLLKLKAMFVLVKLKGCQEVFGRPKFKIK